MRSQSPVGSDSLSQSESSFFLLLLLNQGCGLLLLVRQGLELLQLLLSLCLPAAPGSTLLVVQDSFRHRAQHGPTQRAKMESSQNAGISSAKKYGKQSEGIDIDIDIDIDTEALEAI